MNYLIANISDIDWWSLSNAEIDTLLFNRLARYESAIAVRGGKRPKREGHIIERIASFDNLLAADDDAQRGKRNRRVVRNGKVIHVPNRYIRRHNRRKEKELRELQMMILTLEFPSWEFSSQEIKTDAGKVRMIIKQHFFPWRILHHAILRVIEPKVNASLIPGAFACIKGRGLHYGVRMLKKMLRRHKEWKWFWKTDFKKFYQSIPHELIEEELSSLFKDKHFIALMRIALFNYESGDEIIKLLNDESERTKRFAHWCRDKPDDRQPVREAH